MSDKTKLTNSMVVEYVKDHSLYFKGGVELTTKNDPVDESREDENYLSFADLSIDDFKGLTFDLTGDGFFRRIKHYGVELIATNGQVVKVPGYGFSNDAYYTSELDLVINIKYDIANCWEEMSGKAYLDLLDKKYDYCTNCHKRHNHEEDQA